MSLSISLFLSLSPSLSSSLFLFLSLSLSLFLSLSLYLYIYISFPLLYIYGRFRPCFIDDYTISFMYVVFGLPIVGPIRFLHKQGALFFNTIGYFSF